MRLLMFVGLLVCFKHCEEYGKTNQVKQKFRQTFCIQLTSVVHFLIFIGLYSSVLIQTAEIPHRIPVTVATLGGSLTLACPVSADDAGLFYWYKLRFGYMVQTIAGGSLYKLSLRGPFKNSRFTVTPGDDLNFLHIKNISKEDEATYFCQSGAAYDMRVNNATVLVVNGKVCLFQ